MSLSKVRGGYHKKELGNVTVTNVILNESINGNQYSHTYSLCPTSISSSKLETSRGGHTQ